MSIPTMISSFFGMNVKDIPFENMPHAFMFIVILSFILSAVIAIFMIKKKFFTNARIDEVNNQLVLPSMAQRQQEQNYNAQASNVSTLAPQIEMTTCKCPNCGGMNKIAKGMVAECDFCGSPLQG